MKRRSFLSALAALPFLPKLLREKPPALGLPIGPAVSTWHGIPIADMEGPAKWEPPGWTTIEQEIPLNTLDYDATYQEYVRIRDEKWRRVVADMCRRIDAELLEIPTDRPY